ncbi:uncharacterized protein BKA78DRAFT_129194 [Phyllosticta capitalensis]|uniref:uncharacterized protein n=1 Tax=Phyllosticta capitalensis TaxID=121624 RepID=UPI003131B528
MEDGYGLKRRRNERPTNNRRLTLFDERIRVSRGLLARHTRPTQYNAAQRAHLTVTVSDSGMRAWLVGWWRRATCVVDVLAACPLCDAWLLVATLAHLRCTSAAPRHWLLCRALSSGHLSSAQSAAHRDRHQRPTAWREGRALAGLVGVRAWWWLAQHAKHALSSGDATIASIVYTYIYIHTHIQR